MTRRLVAVEYVGHVLLLRVEGPVKTYTSRIPHHYDYTMRIVHNNEAKPALISTLKHTVHDLGPNGAGLMAKWRLQGKTIRAVEDTSRNSAGCPIYIARSRVLHKQRFGKSGGHRQ